MPRILIVLLCGLLAACAKKEAAFAPESSGAVGGLARPDSLLAYEHSVSVEVGAGELTARMQTVQSACLEGRHGACSLLEFRQGSGRHPNGRLRMRLAPEGVEPLVAAAAQGGALSARSTLAEDLSAEVAETGRQRAQLEQQMARLQELSSRRDLTVSDQLTLARELSTLEVQLQQRERESAQQNLRLETNLLTIEFSVPYEHVSRWSSVGEAWDDSLDNFADGLIEAIELLAYALPYLMFGFPLALIWWLLWRLVTRPLRRGPLR
jgi:hypothetical protein